VGPGRNRIQRETINVIKRRKVYCLLPTSSIRTTHADLTSDHHQQK